jgi:hypothetical protein
MISWPSALLGRDKSLVVATSATISRWRHNQRYDFAWSLGTTNPKNFVFRFVFRSLNRNFDLRSNLLSFGKTQKKCVLFFCFPLT